MLDAQPAAPVQAPASPVSRPVEAPPRLARPLPSRHPGMSRPPSCRPARGRRSKGRAASHARSGCGQFVSTERYIGKMSIMPTVARHPESTPGPARATYQDVLDAPAHRVAEIVEGVLHTHPRPAMPHALASSVLGRRIGNPFHDKIGGPGGWWIIDEPELHLGEDILVPDLAGWRRDRMPDFPETECVTLAPHWVCEVLSDSISMASARFMLEKAFRTCGSSMCRIAPWKHSNCATPSGC